MDYTVHFDYCASGKGDRLFGRIKGRGVQTHRMHCLGDCRNCSTQFRADVTYRGQTHKIAERTGTEFMEEAEKRTGLKLKPYVQAANQFTKKKK